tara:strand:+ start:15474 stop:16253 length:780 start_codon:yes stop_codon:yes gene_type:complete
MKIVIDNREPNDLKAILKSRLNNSEENIIEEANLELGDIQFIKNDKPILIFERKSLNDLIASIKDGRYNEQSFRLNECLLKNKNIYYLIEGNIMNFCNKHNETLQKMLFSSMLSLSYKKGFSLLHTNNIIETAEFIIRFYEKMKNEKYIQNNENNEIKEIKENNENNDNDNDKDYCEVIKSSKKSKITRDNINEIMLCQIPNISVNIASNLMEKYETIENLILNLRGNPDALNDFRIVGKNSDRKISKNVIKNLKDYLI